MKAEKETHNNGIAIQFLEIRTKSGHRYRCTPNHLFLTQRGCVKAQKLNHNDILIKTNDTNDTILSIKPINET